MIQPLYQDPFSPKLISPASVVHPVSDEQKMYIKRVLDISSSDSRFSEKAYTAISQVLTGGVVKVPIVASLSPSSATIGDPDFVIHVHGTNFTTLSKIIWNGSEEPTTFVGRSELTTGVNMSTVSVPSVVSVAVLSEDGILSNSMEFSFVESGGGFSTFAAKSDASKITPVKIPSPVPTLKK